MKKCFYKKLAMFLIIVLLAPVVWNENGVVASAAATPSLTKTSLTLIGIGDTYDINIKNKVAKSKYKWTTSNQTIATVKSSGLVTSVGSGSATIKCLITYPNKKTKTLSCKVTVTIPATDIEIKHDTLENNSYKLPLGSTVDLEAILTPANTTDYVYWYIDQDNVLSDPTCISLDPDNKGIVTGLKAGKAVIGVKAAKTATQAAADTSDIKDELIIEVVAPSATVSSADIVETNQIKVVFDSPVQKNTVINSDGTLSSNITISLCKNVKNVLADDPGKLMASLSDDGKTLTINSANAFDGTYGINFSNKILTTSGVALEEYYKQMTFTDTVAPSITSTTMDDSGTIATINFNETIDFSSFAVKGATVVTTTASASANTLSILGNTSNYVISQDKKSISINMSNISPTDYGKLFCITIAGIKDLAGNTPTSFTLTAYIGTDATAKPQAKLLTLVRTGYNTVTATFDRAIKSGGFIQINSGTNINGVVDANNTKQVNYTISDIQAQLTGSVTVSIGYWTSYNVVITDTTANMLYSKTVDFTIEKVSPYIAATDFDAATNILTLTFSEDVTVSSSSGVFTASRTTANDDIKNGINISYAVLNSTANNIVKLKLTINDTMTGNYTFAINQGFAFDDFRNLSTAKSLTISNASGATELPGPYMITQSSSNLSEITILFANKLDLASAQTASNYTIAGVPVLSAVVSSNTTETGATVVLTVPEGAIDVTLERPITIIGVKGYNNSYAPITSYSTSVLLKDNKKPYYIDPPVFDTVSKNVIKLNFSEPIQGNLTVSVTQVSGNVSINLTNTVSVNGNCAYITLGSLPTNGSYLRINITANNITDISGNAATFASTTLGVLASW